MFEKVGFYKRFWGCGALQQANIEGVGSFHRKGSAQSMLSFFDGRDSRWGYFQDLSGISGCCLFEGGFVAFGLESFNTFEK